MAYSPIPNITTDLSPNSFGDAGGKGLSQQVITDLGIPEVQNFSVEKADQIVFIDFCPEMDVLRTLLENEDLDVIILDHHDTALERLKTFPTHMYTNLTIILTEILS